jgi:hypothetical protein
LGDTTSRRAFFAFPFFGFVADFFFLFFIRPSRLIAPRQRVQPCIAGLAFVGIYGTRENAKALNTSAFPAQDFDRSAIRIGNSRPDFSPSAPGRRRR